MVVGLNGLHKFDSADLPEFPHVWQQTHISVSCDNKHHSRNEQWLGGNKLILKAP